jgi:hypothetical protein
VPLERGERVVEWLVPPVVVKGVICAKVVLAFVLCAQVAFSFVVTASVVLVVFAARLVKGAVMVTLGGVVLSAVTPVVVD